VLVVHDWNSLSIQSARRPPVGLAAPFFSAKPMASRAHADTFRGC
jgi:hypothetical protein